MRPNGGLFLVFDCENVAEVQNCYMRNWIPSFATRALWAMFLALTCWQARPASAQGLDGGAGVISGGVVIQQPPIAGPVAPAALPTAPSIVQGPASQTNIAESTITLSVQAAGTEPLSYQWKENGTNIVGATNSSLILTNAQPSQSGSYLVTVSNVVGSIDSDPAIVTVTPIGPPQILLQPQTLTIIAGGTATFTVEATNGVPLSYQWSRNGIVIQGATGSSVSITNVQPTDMGDYSVMVSNDEGGTASALAGLTVTTVDFRQLMIGSIVATNGQVVVPINLISLGNEHSVAFSLGFNANVLTSPSAALAFDPTSTNAVGTSSAGSSRQLHVGLSAEGASILNTDTSLLANGLLGITVTLPQAEHFLLGTQSVVSVSFGLAEGVDPAAAALHAGLSIETMPTGFSLTDTNGTNLDASITVLAQGTAGRMSDQVVDQSGLFVQTVTVINPAAMTLQNIDVVVHGLTNDSLGNMIRVFNIAGTTLSGAPYVQFGPLAPASSVTLTVEFYVSDRTTKPTPVYEFQTTAPAVPTIGSGSPTSLSGRFVNNQVLLDFPTTSGVTYYVQYSGSATSTNWLTSLPGIAGTGSAALWIDDGPPRTASSPSTNTIRFYRLVTYP